MKFEYNLAVDQQYRHLAFKVISGTDSDGTKMSHYDGESEDAAVHAYLGAIADGKKRVELCKTSILNQYMKVEGLEETK